MPCGAGLLLRTSMLSLRAIVDDPPKKDHAGTSETKTQPLLGSAAWKQCSLEAVQLGRGEKGLVTPNQREPRGLVQTYSSPCNTAQQQ